MTLRNVRFKSKDELKKHVKTHAPTFYYSSQTSTVIPYDKLESLFQEKDLYLGDLSSLPGNLELLENGNLIVQGAVNWKEAKEFLKSKNRNIMTSPTEDLALITAGAATSCTGERCFSFGTLRSQIVRIKYINFNGVEKELSSKNSFPIQTQAIHNYNQDYLQYEKLKNAPFPRLKNETDLLIGTEGQLGVITEVELKTTENYGVNHLFMLVPKWEEDSSPHAEVLTKIENFRKEVILCELIDSNSFSYLPQEERPNQGLDAIFFEIKSDFFEKFYEKFLLDLSFLDENKVFEISENKFHQIRANVPRAVFEENSKRGIIKRGTDIQVQKDDFQKLMNIYRSFTQLGIEYNCFGHFGDAHLHFNFLPLKEQIGTCENKLKELYIEIEKMKGSPFAEHGIGIIKQKYITQFWSKNQFQVFKELKKEFDPYNQFFPQGFMSLSQENSGL